MVAAPSTAQAAKPTREAVSTKPDLRCCAYSSSCSSITAGSVGIPSSFHPFPLQRVCHLIQSSFISSYLSFQERVCRMFMYTSFFKEHAKTKFLGVLEILQIKYKDIYTWVERTILPLHYSQYLFPLGNRSGFFQAVLCQRPSSGNRHILRITAGADDCDTARGKRWRQPSSSPSELSCPCCPRSFYFYFCPWDLEAKPRVVSLSLQLQNNISNKVLSWTEFLSKIWCQGDYILYYLLCNDSNF